MIKLSPKQSIAFKYLTDPFTREIVYGGSAAGGKAQPLDSVIYTPNGETTMGELRLGQIICGTKGNQIVQGIFPQGEKEVFEITFSDGAKTRACGDHLWDCWVSRGGQKSRRIRDTNEILEKMRLTKQKFIIPLAKCEFSEVDVPVDPYFLGVILGDGGLSAGFTLTTGDQEIVDNITPYLITEEIKILKRDTITYTIYSGKRNKKGFCINPLKEKFNKLGLAPIKCHERFVPNIYKYNSSKIRLKILQGLMDTDGYVDSRGHLSYTSKSLQLAKDVQFLARSLGGRATIKKVVKGCKKHNFVGEYYTVYIVINQQIVTLKRKVDRLKPFNGGVSENGRRIVKIESVGLQKCQCIKVSGEDHLYFTDDFILTHNTFLGCTWILWAALTYPETVWFVGRRTLKALRQSTLATFYRVLKANNLEKDKDYKMNEQFLEMTFIKTDSKVIFGELEYQPSDPEYQRYGSLELTGAFIDEIGDNIREKAKDVILTRIRHNLPYYEGTTKGGQVVKVQLKKLLMTCNPTPNWVYCKYYLPYVKNQLEPDQVFVMSSMTDNPFLSSEYLKDMEKRGNQNSFFRAMTYGIWEFDDSNDLLFKSDDIQKLFSVTPQKEAGQRWITADVARKGSDKSVIIVWYGLTAKIIKSFEKNSIPDLRNLINTLCQEHNVPISNVIVDEDGVGGGLVDLLPGCIGFKNGSAALNGEAFINLRSQCWSRLSRYVREDKMAVGFNNAQAVADLIEELSAIKETMSDKSMKMQASSKEDIKGAIGRSSDFADNFMMRMYPELAPKRSFFVV